ncbi:hypothetical protein [Paracoccus haematequi]|uniref:hypothetical protein n=1 Tax=Paracoccus haematequi TaxID=2491866 RepID=UPI000F7E2F5A|nr:hypothetical protein [Paracoccus haematequi]
MIEPKTVTLPEAIRHLEDRLDALQASIRAISSSICMLDENGPSRAMMKAMLEAARDHLTANGVESGDIDVILTTLSGAEPPPQRPKLRIVT